MNKIAALAPTGTRILLGLVFFVFGLNGFLNFLPQPEVPPAAGALLGAFAASGYMFPLIKGTEVIAGALLLSGRAVPLALVLLAPVIVNIALFHAVLAPGSWGMVGFLIASSAYLAWTHRAAYSSLFASAPRAETSDNANRTADATA